MRQRADRSRLLGELDEPGRRNRDAAVLPARERLGAGDAAGIDRIDRLQREIEMAERDMSLRTTERSIDRTELYDADEVFFTGTGVQISPVTRIDGRRIGSGEPGQVTMELQQRYLRAVRGDDPAYGEWLTPIY